MTFNGFCFLYLLIYHSILKWIYHFGFLKGCYVHSKNVLLRISYPITIAKSLTLNCIGNIPHCALNFCKELFIVFN